MDGAAFEGGTADEGLAARSDRVLQDECSELVARPVRRCQVIPLPFELEDEPVPRIGKARRVLDERVKDALQVERRPADDLEDLARRGLLIERLLGLVE